MGNQISGIAPSQILPVENYIIDLNSRIYKQLNFQRSLGSTRFLKVVMCLSDRGPVVVKIFVIHDVSLNLTQHKIKVKAIAEKLSSAVNCLPFHRVEVTEKAAFVLRQYVKSSLYDRISTRPFLSFIEKKWLAFQLLLALSQCHQEQICHGDIKLENLLVTSWSWLVLSDFAAYKPVLLPEDNPTDFTYYFDTSRRRVCNIAPERFIKTIQKEDEAVEKELHDTSSIKLTPSMDIFAAGCVLAELFTEGFYPFNLMQLLQYRTGSYYPDKVLDKITDSAVRNIIEKMIRMSPEERPSAAIFLEQERGCMFPSYFYSILWPYYKQFAMSPGLTADERIQKMEESLPEVLNSLLFDPQDGATKETEDSLTEIKADGAESRMATSEDLILPKNGLVALNNKDDATLLKANCEALIIVTSLVTSCVRSLHFPSSKLLALKLFRILSKYASSDVILDRILPYIINLLKDPEPTVRSESLLTLTYCLTMVTSVPRSEVNIFLEYIFPNLNDITQDSAVIARQTEAANIASIADTSARFVEYCLHTWSNYSNDGEMLTLQEIIQQKLAKLFSDSSNVVKRTLIEETLNSLCLFFGKEKANDVLLSHLITFLNEKKDPHLRLSFYKNITGIAAFMGTSCNPILKPLLLQGLSDTEENVSLGAIETMSAVAEIGIFPDHSLQELVADAAPLLVHPNFWIRQAVVGLVVTISKVLPFLDVQTTISMVLKPFVMKTVLQYDNETCILSALEPPLPRGVYDVLVKCADVTLVLNVLQETSANNSDVSNVLSSLGEGNQPVKNVMKRLLAAGLTNSMLPSIMSLQDHLTKVHRHRKVLDTLQMNKENTAPGIYGFSNLSDNLSLTHRFKLIPNDVAVELSPNVLNSSQATAKSSNLTMNEEWQTMFGGVPQASEEELRSSGSTQSSSKQIASSLGTSFSSSQMVTLEHSTLDNGKNVPPCQHDLEKVLQVKREELMVTLQSRKVGAGSANEGMARFHRWRPKGHLIAHLHEHKGAITRLVALKGTALYASSSKDGTVKLWDANKTERTFPVNRSKFTYSEQRGIITTLTHCSVHESIASASDNGSIHVFRLDKQNLVVSRQLNKISDGYALNLEYMDAGAHSLLTYSTVYGKIIGWDLRSPGNAWVAENGVKKGVVTSYAIDASNNWLACGTSSGAVVCWDLRFMLPISQVNHPHGHSVQRVKIHPREPSGVVASFRANNEVILWDMETQSRTKTLWASPSPPFSEKPSRARGPAVLDNWVHGLVGCRTESGEVAVITAGTDSRIRYWDLDTPETSYVISHPALFSNSSCSFTYKSRVIDGSEVISESMSPNPHPPSSSEDSPKRGNGHPPTGHIETITDVITVNYPQRMLISSGFDGTIKMWK